MASGNYAQRFIPQEPESIQASIPPRATRQLPALNRQSQDLKETGPLPLLSQRPLARHIVDEYEEHHLAQHMYWLRPLLLSMVVVIVAAVVLISAGYLQRPGSANLVISTNAQVFPIQVGGTIGQVNTWTKSKGPIAIKKPITQTGPYSVLGKPTLSVAFMNKVLSYYHSPAAGLAQYLYDDGVKYGIDPAFALAFFMHESSFGTTGIAVTTLSLGNMRCVPEYPCLNESGGFAQFSSWQQGFEAWFKMIRNLYVAQWNLVTVDQIIPVYAPSSDHNDVAEYIASLKYELDTWHSGIVAVP
jgi:hypothetical protein